LTPIISGGGALGEALDLRHEGAGRVHDPARAGFQVALNFGRDAVRADDGRLALAHLVRRVNGADAGAFEPDDLLRVVDERPERADGRALCERALDHLDRPLDPETETVFLGQKYLHKFQPAIERLSAVSTRLSAFTAARGRL
jgi:hypothetical protein